jgi:hypothetical protein
MQASTSGFFVRVNHDHSDSTDLRVDEAEKFLAELAGATAEVRRAHDDAISAGHGFGGAETVKPSEEKKAEAKAADKPKAKRVTAKKPRAKAKA